MNNYFIQDLIKIYKIFPEHYISELIISKIDFNSEYYLREIISIFLLSENQIKLITQNFTSKSAALEISNIINSIQVFNQYNIEIRIEQIDFFSNRNVSLEDIIEIIKLLKVLKDWNYNSLELQINNFLNNYSSDNSDILLQVIKDSSSVIIMESAIKKCNALSNPEEYLDLLLKSELLNEVNKELLKNNLINYISVYPIRILEIALKSLPHYYDLFASQIVLNNQIIIGFYELLQKNELKIKQLTKSKCDLNIVAFFHFNLSEKESIQNINDLFKRYNYDFQSTILKFYFKQYKLNKLSRSQIFSVINSIQCVELSALMLRTFINNRVDNRDELMNLMNQILKSHFKLLSDLNLTDTTFKNIFSIENLVKMCNGRKSYSGTTFWKGGNDVRFYTKGNHFISIGYKEQMLCEGRFWKSQPFYNSVTNKPTEEQYTFYWCKNSACASVNDSIDFNLPFYKWSLLEINELFEINLDRLAFTHLAGWLNRMQSIFDRMKCQECNNLLRPKAFTPHLLGYYAVPLFHCANELCSSFKREVRFTHCRGCSKILDSRECRICQSCNWLICDNDSCGKCGCGANHISVYVQYP